MQEIIGYVISFYSVNVVWGSGKYISQWLDLWLDHQPFSMASLMLLSNTRIRNPVSSTTLQGLHLKGIMLLGKQLHNLNTAIPYEQNPSFTLRSFFKNLI